MCGKFATIFEKGKTLFPLCIFLNALHLLFNHKTKPNFKKGQVMLLDSLIFSMLVVLMLFYVVAFVSDFESGALVWQEVVERQRVAFSISELFLNDPGSPVGWVENPDRFGFAYYDFLKRQVRESVVFLPAKRVGFLNSLDSNDLNKLLNVGMGVAVVVESDLVDVCFPLKQCNENNKFVEGPVVVIAGGKSVDCVVVSRIVSVRTESDVGLGVLRVRVC